MYSLQDEQQSVRAKRGWLFGRWVTDGGSGGGGGGGYDQPSAPVISSYDPPAYAPVVNADPILSACCTCHQGQPVSQLSRLTTILFR